MQQPKSSPLAIDELVSFLDKKIQQCPPPSYYGLTQRFKTDRQLLYWLYQYVAFNSVFAGGVANLAGEIHLRTDLFRDAKESIVEYADRSAEIAAHIFFAATDEYGAPHQEPRTHRRLAQLFLYHSAQHLQIDTTIFEEWRADILPVIKMVQEGYRMNCSNTNAELLQGIGFHLASEWLADQEFNMIHSYLQETYPKLFDALQTTGQPNAYTWVEVHTHVEAEHAEHALSSARKAIRYYQANEDKNWVAQQIQLGFLAFEKVQHTFFENLRTRLNFIE